MLQLLGSRQTQAACRLVTPARPGPRPTLVVAPAANRGSSSQQQLWVSQYAEVLQKLRADLGALATSRMSATLKASFQLPSAAAPGSQDLQAHCQQLSSILQKHGQELSLDQLTSTAACLKRLVKALGTSSKSKVVSEPLLQALVAAITMSPTLKSHADLATWSTLLHTLATVGKGMPKARVSAALAAGTNWMSSQGPRVWTQSSTRSIKSSTVCHLLWAYAACGYTGDVSPLVAGVNAACEDGVMRSAAGWEWCTTVWALSKLNTPASGCGPVWQKATPAITWAIANTCTAQDISMALYAAATSDVQYAGAAFAEAACEAFQTRRDALLSGAKPQAFSNILIATTKLTTSTHTAQLAQLCCEQLLQRARQHHRTPSDGNILQSLVIACMALGQLRMYNHHIFSTTMQQLLAQAPQADVGPTTTCEDDTCPAPAQHAAQPQVQRPAAISGRSRAWRLDVLTVLFAVASVYPGYAYSLALKAGAVTTSSSSTQPHHISAGLSSDEVKLLSDLEAGMQAARQLLQLLGSMNARDLTSWDARALSNTLWTWALLLPMRPQGSVMWVQTPGGLGCAEGSSDSEGSDRRVGSSDSEGSAHRVRSSASNAAAAGVSRLPGTTVSVMVMPVSSTDHSADLSVAGQCPTWMHVADHVFCECVRRGPEAFAGIDLVQLYVAHQEAVERHLPMSWVGSALLDPDLPLTQAARQAWEKRTLDMTSINTSMTQTVLGEYLTQQGFTIVPEGTIPGTLLAPMRTDLLVTSTPQGQACCAAVEVDGEHHFLQNPSPGVYSAAGAFRHQQLSRRVQQLVVVPACLLPVSADLPYVKQECVQVLGQAVADALTATV